MPRVRRRNAYRHVSDFDKSRIAAYSDCSYSYRGIAARIGHDPITAEYGIGGFRRAIWSAVLDPKGFVAVKMTGIRMACNGSCNYVSIPESTVGDVCKRTTNCTNSSTTFAAAWNISSETMAASLTGASVMVYATTNLGARMAKCLQHHDGRIRVWRHRGERTLEVCICYRHTGVSPGLMVWDAIGYTSRSPLVRIDEDHQNKIQEIKDRTERFRYSFIPRAIREWNGR